MTEETTEAQERLTAAMRSLQAHCTDIEFTLDPNDIDSHTYELKPGENLHFSFPHDDSGGCIMPCEEVVRMADDCNEGNLDSGGAFRSRTLYLRRLEPMNGEAFKFLYFISCNDFRRLLTTEATSKKGICHCSLRTGPTPFAICIIKAGWYDQYNPPIANEDIFLEVRHPPSLTAAEVNEIADAFLFELSSTLGMEFRPSPRGPLELPFDPTSSESYVQKIETCRLRPIMTGPGVGPVAGLFVKAIAQTDPDLQISGFARVIEWVSATVSKVKAYDEVRRRLLDAKALAPDANYIRDLQQLFEDLRTYQKDAEAIRLTVEACCDPVQLAPLAPAVAASLRKITQGSLKQEKTKALGEFSDIISSTRNMVVHAKANYESSGKECPHDQMETMTKCLQKAAEQCVRWYANSDPTMRVF